MHEFVLTTQYIRANRELHTALPVRMGNITRRGSGAGQVNSTAGGKCVVCDDCGRVFMVAQEISSGTDKKKRCERYCDSLQGIIDCLQVEI